MIDGKSPINKNVSAIQKQVQDVVKYFLGQNVIKMFDSFGFIEFKVTFFKTTVKNALELSILSIKHFRCFIWERTIQMGTLAMECIFKYEKSITKKLNISSARVPEKSNCGCLDLRNWLSNVRTT